MQLASEKERNLVLYKAKKLKTSVEYSKCYFNADLTACERVKFKELRELRKKYQEEEPEKDKFRWAIRNDGLVRFKALPAQSPDGNVE